MKIQKITKTTALVAALLAIALTSANALTVSQKAAVDKAFTKVKAPELASKAAQMVAQTPAADKEGVALEIVSVVVPKRPNLAAALVSAISAVAPETAPAVAAKAAALVKGKDASETIAVAAVKYAPAQSEQIAREVGNAVPDASGRVLARVRSTMRSAATPSTSGTISVTPGVIRGLPFTPPTPPTPPIVAPTVGFDPHRYSSP